MCTDPYGELKQFMQLFELQTEKEIENTASSNITKQQKKSNARNKLYTKNMLKNL